MRIIDINGNAGIKGAETEFNIKNLGEANSVVAIYAYNVLQHLEERPEDFMGAAWNILKEEGFLHLIIPIAPYKNAFNGNPKRFFTNETFSREGIDKTRWKILNYDISMVKEDNKNPNTWESTVSVKLQPIKEH